MGKKGFWDYMNLLGKSLEEGESMDGMNFITNNVF